MEEGIGLRASCIANIGPRERKKRRNFGLSMLGVGALLAVALVGLHAGPWRLLAFLPFSAGALGYFQARDKTWVSLAQRGTRDMDSGVEQIKEASEVLQVRRQAQRVLLKSVLTGAVLTAIVLLVGAMYDSL